ncbi:MAG TPA: nitroreductase [Clostridiaceae bacterium]|nr:nitroreductase [Clostridiaceae bacterium]
MFLGRCIREVNMRDAMLKRKSIRTYKDEAVPQDLRQKIINYAYTVKAPFNTKMRFQIVDLNNTSPDIKLGTYRVIRGATTYICAVTRKESRMEESLGYVFENIILYATSLSLGTCWLGGTFNKTEFVKALNLSEDECVPVITPIGYSKDKRSLVDTIMAAAAGSRNRKDWTELFFDKDFSKPLKKEEAGIFSECLEMVRVAPSASNRQPWRIVKDRNNFHFFLCRNKLYGKILDFDIQKVDIGIAMCHFELTARELGISGIWRDMKPGLTCPKNVEYIISYAAQ